MSDVLIDGRRYRLNVGVVLFNAKGQAWLGRRADRRGDKIWQFPQGGVDAGEDLLAAARRELFEETGVRTVSLISRAPGWITYDFPPGFSGSKAIKGFVGQTQAWFAFRFEGEESEIDLAAHEVAEFDAWRWADLHEAPGLVAEFKRAAYEKVIKAFEGIAAGAAPQEGRRGVMLMIHGAGCTGGAFTRMAADFRLRGWRVEAPTLSPSLRVGRDPPKALADLELQDYVAEAEGWARRLQAETDSPLVLVGHAMGGLIVQKLLERGVGQAGVLLTPAPPVGVAARPTAASAFTFANILLQPGADTPKKIWRAGFEWGVLNRVPKGRRGAVYEEAVYEAPKVWRDLTAPDREKSDAARIDERRIVAKVLTIAAAKDRATPAAWARETSRKYEIAGGAFRCYEDHAHWIIDEPGTDQVTADIDAWLDAALA